MIWKENYQLNVSEEIEDEVRNMCLCSQVIEGRGVEKGILIYRTLVETKSIQQTAVKT